MRKLSDTECAPAWGPDEDESFALEAEGRSLFHQPPREHRAGVFIKPLIEQRSNFLAKVGGMTETREFVGLERCSGSGQQEFPRRLCFITGHGRSCGDRNSTVTIN